MGKHETITADVSEAMSAAIREAIATGAYDSAADIVRHALTEWQMAERTPKISIDALGAMLQASMEGDEGADAEAFFDQLEADLDEMIAADERVA